MKSVFKEANYSDEDVWEPSLRKEKAPAVTKPSRHSSNKKVNLSFFNIFFGVYMLYIIISFVIKK